MSEQQEIKKEKPKQVKRAVIRELIDLGLIQEMNRQFLHRAGFSLDPILSDTGTILVAGISDYRDDPEGVFFSQAFFDPKGADNVLSLIVTKHIKRVKSFDVDPDGVQKIGEEDKSFTIKLKFLIASIAGLDNKDIPSISEEKITTLVNVIKNLFSNNVETSDEALNFLKKCF